MMDLVRGWLMCVTGAALVAAIADSLMPKGPVKQVGKLACALLLLWAVLSPVVHLDVPELFQGAGALQDQVEQQRRQLEQDSGAMMKTLIQRQCAAYIADKAAELGLKCTAEVECVSGEGGTWLPWSVRVEGTMTEEQREALGGEIERQLDIPPQRQRFVQG